LGSGRRGGLGLGLGLGFGFGEGDGLGEHERAVVVFVVEIVVEVGCAEVDAGAALQGREEGGGHVGTHPVCHAVQHLARHGALAALHRLIFLMILQETEEAKGRLAKFLVRLMHGGGSQTWDWNYFPNINSTTLKIK
jgi:hypothetical protein